MIPYLPFGLILTVLRLFMSLQVLLMLLLVPEGKLKRWVAVTIVSYSRKMFAGSPLHI